MSNVLVLIWQLRIPGCRSLKEKRMTVRSLRDRLRHRFHVSVAETAFQDIHDLVEITVALVASDGRTAEALADKLDRFVAGNTDAIVTSSSRNRV